MQIDSTHPYLDKFQTSYNAIERLLFAVTCYTVTLVDINGGEGGGGVNESIVQIFHTL